MDADPTPEPMPADLPMPVPPPRRWTALVIAAWVVILIITAFIAWRAAASQMASAGRGDSAATQRISAQYAVGVQAAFGGMTGMSSIDEKLLRSLDENADSPVERFRVAIVSGELTGREEAMNRLEQLAGETVLADDLRIARALYEDEGVDATDWASFEQRHRWYALLLAAHGKPAGDPARSAALQAAYRTLLMVAGAVAVAGALTLAGLVLLIIGMMLLARRRIRPAFRRDDPPGVRAQRGVYVLSFACYLASSIGLGYGLRYLGVQRMEVALVTAAMAWGAGMLIPLFFGQSWAQWRAALGLQSGRGIFREIGAGLVGYVAGLPIVALGVVLTLVLTLVSGMNGAHPITEELEGSGWHLALIFVLACVFAPITEELLFRGALLAHLRQHLPWWIAAPIVALLFAAIHPQGWVAIPALASLALVFAGIREWRGSIYGCIAAHAVHNGMALAFATTLLRQ